VKEINWLQQPIWSQVQIIKLAQLQRYGDPSLLRHCWLDFVNIRRGEEENSEVGLRKTDIRQPG